jgi:hypothetical protein
MANTQAQDDWMFKYYQIHPADVAKKQREGRAEMQRGQALMDKGEQKWADGAAQLQDADNREKRAKAQNLSPEAIDNVHAFADDERFKGRAEQAEGQQDYQIGRHEKSRGAQEIEYAELAKASDTVRQHGGQALQNFELDIRDQYGAGMQGTATITIRKGSLPNIPDITFTLNPDAKGHAEWKGHPLFVDPKGKVEIDFVWHQHPEFRGVVFSGGPVMIDKLKPTDRVLNCMVTADFNSAHPGSSTTQVQTNSHGHSGSTTTTDGEGGEKGGGVEIDVDPEILGGKVNFGGKKHWDHQTSDQQTNTSDHSTSQGSGTSDSVDIKVVNGKLNMTVTGSG